MNCPVLRDSVNPIVRPHFLPRLCGTGHRAVTRIALTMRTLTEIQVPLHRSWECIPVSYRVDRYDGHLRSEKVRDLENAHVANGTATRSPP